MLVDVPVKISSHKTLNSRRGVIYSSDLRDATEEEILENLAPQGVSEVRRLKAKREGRLINTNSFVLTFRLSTLPKDIKVLWLNLEVRPYIASPLRCFKCQRYGHHKNACRQAARCARCGSLEHPEGECDATPKCVNCEDDHPAYAKSCSVWQREKAIQKIKAEKNVSYLEARRTLETNTPRLPGNVTYAQAVVPKVKTVSRGFQTDAVWPNGYTHPTTVDHFRQPSTSSRVEEEQPPPPRKNTERTKKGSNDQIRNYNRFGPLQDVEVEPKANRRQAPKPRSKSETRSKEQIKENKKKDQAIGGIEPTEPMELSIHPESDDELLTEVPDHKPTPQSHKQPSAARKKILPP
jgi:hypothetical protein